MRVWILRLGHRRGRDPRLTTHVALTARAFGCEGIILSGEKDDSIVENIIEIRERWGGNFEVRYEKNWKDIIKNWKGKIVHLTMYGLPIQEKINEIKSCKEDLLVIVGSQQVPGEVYQLSDWNISVTNQPHSEVAALSILLDRFFEGRELKKEFKNARIKIVPQEKGKKITSLKEVPHGSLANHP
jgi:tRNA (cytidine56-2'-O)-methyltransferase